MPSDYCPFLSPLSRYTSITQWTKRTQSFSRSTVLLLLDLPLDWGFDDFRDYVLRYRCPFLSKLMHLAISRSGSSSSRDYNHSAFDADEIYVSSFWYHFYIALMEYYF